MYPTYNQAETGCELRLWTVNFVGINSLGGVFLC